ncbi:hypothetical protein BDV3_002607 [Batrachochytrium dendrobatidis]|uniref:ABC transporter domain-containing protein n=1 Tax=Batrachochytrium dendrobatidis (strain JEL423) TaxID=403673 RepID=A0A177WXB2_BATDL|nr:hypothetical protein BDEG_27309 [Batrachochytrium dendrobatidis JEL423]
MLITGISWRAALVVHIANSAVFASEVLHEPIHSSVFNNQPSQHQPNSYLGQQLSTSAHNVFSLNRNAADQCPPCFDCHLAIYPCINFGNCSDISGRCDCPIGFGLNNCSQPLCGGLATPTRHARLPDQAKCDCLPGWTGVHCNVCETDRACDSLVPGGQNGTCYNSMHPVKNNHVLCDVTNKAIVDTLKGKKPQLTLNCDKESSVCEFQFWAAEVESFYCKMQECSFTQEHTPTLNITTFECPHMQCKCFPERLLCESNGLDFTEWFNDAQEGPNGPGTFTCEESITDTNVHRTCRFSEPHMNEVISQFFGDPYIKLECPKAGECMHYTQIPGYTRPEFNSNFSPMLIALMSVSGFGLVVVVVGSLVWLQRKADASHAGYLHIVSDDPQSEAPCEEMMSDHVPCTIQFRNLSYAIDTNRLVPVCTAFDLNEVQGRSAQPLLQRYQQLQTARTSTGSPNSSPHPQETRTNQPDLVITDWSDETDTDPLHLSPSNSADFFSNSLNSSINTGSRQCKQKMVVLEEVQGVVRPGQVMAIMGGSGAGKTTLLDILARKNKSGMVSGEILINGRFMDNDDYKSIIGYVDQEDTLMDTLTVYESILYSALLRLPESMTYDAKIKRVEETMLELDILAIANRRIGSAGKRGLSGGEKRRVSIACELVTSPSILFLDEPTSGLDTYNAYNVIESLVSLARDYQRTVIFTIHQPRSNIYALFDQLVLLAKGRVVYSGSAQEAVIDHFVHLGFECPLGYNIADYLVDLTMHVGGKNEQEDSDTATEVSRPPDSPTSPDHSEQMYTSVQTSPAHSHGRHRSTIRALQETLLFSRKSRSDAGSPCLLSSELGSALEATGASKDTDGTAGILRLSELRSGTSSYPYSQSRSTPAATNRASALSARRDQHRITHNPDAPVIRPLIGEQLILLIQGYKTSTVGACIQRDIMEAIAQAYPDGIPHDLHRNGTFNHSVSLTMLPDISNWTALSIQRWFKSVFVNRNQRSNVSMRSTQQRQRASWWIQFKILSGRSFKNLYRNPDLLRTHYIISVVIALICGFLFWKIDNTLAGFQNRLGVMFFICAVFGFGCLSSMQIFAAERLIFVRERANRYYSPITYFIPKILFDMLPLRVLPPLILGLICYHMIGLRPDTFLLLRFLLVLVLFNLTAAAACLAISIIFKDVAVASLIATLVMLFEMLFGGLLLNKSSIPPAFQWMQRISFFNYAFEALVVNEVNGLSLLEEKFGLKIDVPGSVILQAFGLDALGYWEDVKLLGIMCMVFIGIAFIWLQLFVRERR